MTDIVGLLRDKDDDSTSYSQSIYFRHTCAYCRGNNQRRNDTEIDSMTQALREGVKKAFIIDGRVPHSILMELLTDEGMGTMFRSR